MKKLENIPNNIVDEDVPKQEPGLELDDTSRQGAEMYAGVHHSEMMGHEANMRHQLAATTVVAELPTYLERSELP